MSSFSTTTTSTIQKIRSCCCCCCYKTSKRGNNNKKDSDDDKNDDNNENNTNNNIECWAWIKAVRDIINNNEHMFMTPILPVEVLPPWLYLSNMANVINIEKLKQHGITHVLTTNGMPKYTLNDLQTKLKQHNIQHKYVNGQDEEGYDMITNHWNECYTFLKKVKKATNNNNKNNKKRRNNNNNNNTNKVVIHCAAGKNRSALITGAAILILQDDDNDDDDNDANSNKNDNTNTNTNTNNNNKYFNVLDVVKILCTKRGMVLTNQSFQRQLVQLAAKVGKLGPKPYGYTDDPIPIEEYNALLTKPKAKDALKKLL